MKRAGTVLRGLAVVSALLAGQPALTQTLPMMSDSVRLALVDAKAKSTAGDLAGAVSSLKGVSGDTNNPFEKYHVGQLRMEIEAKRNDIAGQRSAIAQIFESRLASAEEMPRLYYMAGILAAQAGDYRYAISQLTSAASLGVETEEGLFTLADAHLRIGETAQALTALERTMVKIKAAGRVPPVSWYDRAISLSYGRKSASDVAAWSQRKLRDHPSPANWRSALMTYAMIAKPSRKAELDLLRLMALTGSYATGRDILQHAALASEAGAFHEARAVLDTARLDGRLDAKDPAYVKAYTGLAQRAQRLLADMPVRAAKAKTPAALIEAADLYFAAAQFARAAELYAAAQAAGSNDAHMLTRLGISRLRSGDVNGGAATLSIIPAGEWQAVAGFWWSWLAQTNPDVGRIAPKP